MCGLGYSLSEEKELRKRVKKPSLGIIILNYQMSFQTLPITFSIFATLVLSLNMYYCYKY